MEYPLMKTRKEIAKELGVSISTLKRWLGKEGIDLPKGRYLRPSEYRKIFDGLGCQKYQP